MSVTKQPAIILHAIAVVLVMKAKTAPYWGTSVVLVWQLGADAAMAMELQAGLAQEKAALEAQLQAASAASAALETLARLFARSRDLYISQHCWGSFNLHAKRIKIEGIGCNSAVS